MPFEIHLKDEIANDIAAILNVGFKPITVSTLNISDGLLTKGNYKIPVEHILFIEEV